MWQGWGSGETGKNVDPGANRNQGWITVHLVSGESTAATGVMCYHTGPQSRLVSLFSPFSVLSIK